ncbi:MAG: hypothetical protein QXT02_05415 [Candidatus Hadarchaeum sp.]|uniref:hypothetical protein n=1 Tax=Candidatus Hadarchaeum sp. TaxID=2883567 RepID=UPI003176169B
MIPALKPQVELELPPAGLLDDLGAEETIPLLGPQGVVVVHGAQDHVIGMDEHLWGDPFW